MIYVGEFNTLKAKRQTDNGFYLCCNEDEEVLLPNKYVPKDFAVNDLLDVFVYKDSEDRIVATTEVPKVIVNEFAFLKVKDVSHIGAFLDWGLEKDLLVPFSEQRMKMEAARFYVVFTFLDAKSGRIAASNKWNKYILPLEEAYNEGDEVELLIANKSELGFTAIIDDHAKGLIYHNEIHQDLNIGERITGYIKTIREDGKVDLMLNKVGMDRLDDSSQIIMDKLNEQNGFLPVHDKSAPEVIYDSLGMSKKTFKKAAGILYKQKLIEITPEGIRKSKMPTKED
jgi:predicted RNA-binding protein (virulence factor B family)